MPLSEKRKKHLARQEKKKQLSRTYEERMEKMDEIYTNFAQTGYPITPQIKNFFSICKKWVNQGGMYEGVITDPDLKINICYTLHNSKRRDVGVMIKRIQDTQQQKNGKSKNNLTTPTATDTPADTPTDTATDTATDTPTDTTTDTSTDTPTDTPNGNTG